MDRRSSDHRLPRLRAVPGVLVERQYLWCMDGGHTSSLTFAVGNLTKGRPGMSNLQEALATIRHYLAVRDKPPFGPSADTISRFTSSDPRHEAELLASHLRTVVAAFDTPSDPMPDVKVGQVWEAPHNPRIKARLVKVIEASGYGYVRYETEDGKTGLLWGGNSSWRRWAVRSGARVIPPLAC